jgi:hypothetical protein
MLRLSRARAIGDIEFMINSPGPALGQRRWTAKGAQCSVDRHTYSGELYGFHADVLHIRMPATGRLAWELVLLTEFGVAATARLCIRSSGSSSSRGNPRTS